MASKKRRREGLVWDTSVGATCPACDQPQDQCRCEEAAGSSVPGPARVSLDRKGRGGKSVTVIEGLGLPAESLRQLAKALKRRSGTGGSAKAGRIEIQGDQRDLVVSELQARGHEVRRVGG